MRTGNISLKALLKRFWKKVLPTWLLVTLEGISLLLMPLVIGWAVDGLIKRQTTGIVQLGALCLALLVIGAGRRFYDTRAYSGIYRIVSQEIVSQEGRRKTGVSKVSARTHLFTEFIEFLENSLPDVFNQLIGLAGTLTIIAFIDIRVFWACLTGAILTALVYILSQKRLLRLNKSQNDEFEQQVDVIASTSYARIKAHFKKLMVWNIRLSDLETINFSLTWFILAAVLLVSIAVVAASESASFGHVVSTVMYVLGFMESVMTFPLYYQQVIRLQEIAGRL